MLTAQLRSALKTEDGFIYRNWLKSYRKSFPSDCPNEVLFTNQHKLIELLLKRAKVTVICDMADHDHLFGFMVHEEHDSCSILHYIYVKPPFQGLKVAKKMYDSLKEPVFYTHRTTDGIRFLEKTDKLRAFNPYLLFEGCKWEA